MNRDECVWFAIQKGLDATRSTIRYYKHNDMDHLEELLSEAANKKELNSRRRAFLVAEAIYFNTGEMCPLKRLVELARTYKLRIILDESLTIGVSSTYILSNNMSCNFYLCWICFACKLSVTAP